ncbi:hypothetical protein GF314_01080, partial [bacterium]|nr:hypothetical protein [bacterium]
MYIALQLILVVAGVLLLVHGGRQRRWSLGIAGGAILVGTWIFFEILDLWGEYLWFEALGFADRFWTVTLTQWGLAAAGAAVGAVVVAVLTRPAGGDVGARRRVAAGVGALVGGLWGFGHWEAWLRFLHGVDAGRVEPVLGRDAGFYMFSLPFLDAVTILLLLLAGASLVASLIPVASSRGEDGGKPPPAGDAFERVRPDLRLHLAAGVILLVLGVERWLQRYHLLDSDWGAVHGAGWTDVHVRLPAYAATAVITAAFGLALLIPAARP